MFIPEVVNTQDAARLKLKNFGSYVCVQYVQVDRKIDRYTDRQVKPS